MLSTRSVENELTTDCVRGGGGTSLQTVDLFLKLNRLTYYSSITVKYKRKQANLSDIQANRSVQFHYD